jgi:hypothetical protein
VKKTTEMAKRALLKDTAELFKNFTYQRQGKTTQRNENFYAALLSRTNLFIALFAVKEVKIIWDPAVRKWRSLS